MIYIKLIILFLKIGLFSFGGGYAMIPLIQREITSKGWITVSEFFDIIAIAEMTPGSIAVTSATFVGFKTAGFLGGLISTLGVITPSFILTLIISKYFFKFQEHPVNTSIFYGVRPVVTGLIFVAALFVAETSIFNGALSIKLIKQLFVSPLKVLNIGSILILAGSLIALLKYKIHPILVIICSGAAGIIFFYLF